MKREITENKSRSYLPFLAIVAVVAIVGIIVLVMNDGKNSSVTVADTEDSGADGALAGEASSLSSRVCPVECDIKDTLLVSETDTYYTLNGAAAYEISVRGISSVGAVQLRVNGENGLIPGRGRYYTFADGSKIYLTDFLYQGKAATLCLKRP